ncbi:phage protease [Nocardia sp. NPDC050697]|uniref:phage protease n=1 Tax=Nocardia sp. NPDC050697 TaxID=3155158 RepID=UPI0033D412E9
MSEALANKSIVTYQKIAMNGNELPKTMEVARAGSWKTPRHGDFDLTLQDLDEAVDNFNAGVHRVQGIEPLAGTLDHLGGNSPAAYRITGLKRVEDSLIADIAWTKLGEEKIERDEYRYVSFEFNPRTMPYINPEDRDDIRTNVLTGGTLTNDPLFKKLKPVLASARTGRGDNHKGEESMDLAAIRAKQVKDLTEEERKFLSDHKADLTEEERKAFGLEDAETEEQKKSREEAEAKAAADEAARKAAEEAEAKKNLEASAGIKGTVTITQEELEQLKAGAAAGVAAKTELLRTQLAASVKTHVDRGAIKSDMAVEAVEILMASSEAQRTRIGKFLESLNGNSLLAGARGSGADAKEDFSLTEAEKQYAEAFGLKAEDIEAHKKAKAGN